MEAKTQTVEQFLVEQLDKIAPGKYTFASALQMFKTKLRFPCSHLKGGGRRHSLVGRVRDFNISIFTFPTGVTEIKCLYNCGLKIRSDEAQLSHAYGELYDLPSTNSQASAEVRHYSKNGKRVPIDPGPVPTYSDGYRKSIKESNDRFLECIQLGIETGRIKPNDKVFGGVFPHPDPVEAPDSRIERYVARAYAAAKSNPLIHTALAVFQDSIPAIEPVTNTKIRRARKTQSRRKRSGK